MEKLSLSSTPSSMTLEKPLATHKEHLLEQSSEPGTPSKGPSKKSAARPTFKVFALVARAISRWGKQINPTFTVGHKKHDEDEVKGPNPAVMRALAARKTMSAQPYSTHTLSSMPTPAVTHAATGRTRTASARTFSGKAQCGAKSMQHGNKTNILLGRLPELQPVVA